MTRANATPSEHVMQASQTDRCRTPLERRSPVLYDFRTGKWNRKYLCVAAVYRLLKRHYVGQARALELLATRHTAEEMKTLRATVALWRAHPIRDMAA